MFNKYQNDLNTLIETSSLRSVKNINKNGKFIEIDGKSYLNLSSNDYLGLSSNSEIKKDFLKKHDYSMASASSRLLTGTSSVYNELENTIAKLYNKDNALLFNSGYHANLGIFSSLINKRDVIFSDKLNHASIIDGIKLSNSNLYRYKHLDYEHLESLLKKHRNDFDTAIIVSESIFSMDGDAADLEKLIELKTKYNAILAIDEAHAFGVMGKNGLGLCEAQNCTDQTDIIIATFGKAIGSYGAFCCANEVIIDYLINKARSFIFSTALPEINIGFSKYIIENILPHTEEARYKLLSTANSLRSEISKSGLKTAGSCHIIPIIIGGNFETQNECLKLQQQGYYVLPIRYPTVPPNTARIRISLRSDIKFDEIKEIPQILTE